ncbi:MAG TPA: diaminopimelate decarboxylase, partial [Thermoanaerobaculia bacterium]|nr:diaminopimelate decarboxylase [Thermoanaerobaculia bacterium]
MHIRKSPLFSVSLSVLLAASALAQTPTLHDGLAKAREDKAADAAAVAAFSRLAKEHGTPLYVYDKASIVENARALKTAFSSRFPKLKIHYAVKANSNAAVVALLRSEGFAGEVVSEGEIAIARRAGIAGSEILFTSSSKSPSEIARALSEGTVLNVDSRDELEQIEAAAAAKKVTARISFRINPGVDPHTIHQINTGISESKFGLHLEDGIAFAAYERAKTLRHVRIVGAHCHIGSQITETSGYELAARKMLAFVLELKEKLGLTLEFLDLGGGIGVPYHDGETVMGPDDLARALEPIWKEGVRALGYEPALWLEPGRFLVAPSGFLVTRVNSVKTTPVKTFVNVDAGFETLVRPAMYQAYHRVRVVGRTEEPMQVDVAGNVCETGDILAAERILPRPHAGDLIVVLDAGAYGF